MIISSAFDAFAHSLRRLGEAQFQFKGLYRVDQDEAIGNLEASFKGVLDDFHSLSDAARSAPDLEVDFYQWPLSNFLLQCRNAKHHNHARRVRGIYAASWEHEVNADYLLVDFPPKDVSDSGPGTVFFICYGDYLFYMENVLKKRYSMPALSIIQSRLEFDTVESVARNGKNELSHVFINVIPIIVGAGAEMAQYLSDKFQPNSMEADTFASLFDDFDPEAIGSPSFELASRDLVRMGGI